MTSDLDPKLIREALAGDIAAQTCLVDALTPEIQWNVAKMLRRWRSGSAAERDLRQEVGDLVQDVFLELFEKDGQALRSWDPDRLPLTAYVGFIARIRAAETLRSRRSPWREEPREIPQLDRPSPHATPEKRAWLRDELEKIYLCLLQGFKPADCHLFDLRFVDRISPQEASDATGKSVAAVYQWQSRLYKRARECRERVSN